MRRLLLLTIMAIIFFSCNRRVVEPDNQALRNRLSNKVRDFVEDRPLSYYYDDDSVQTIDLFGVNLVGPPEHILKELDNGTYIKIDNGLESFLHISKDRLSSRVLIDGIPFGMTFYYDDGAENEKVDNVILITSETGEDVIKRLVKKITEYYGNPEIEDSEERQYTWFPGGNFMKARPLHSDEGGWTFYIQRKGRHN